MVEFVEQTREWFPKNARLRRARLNVERTAARRAAGMVFCTDTAKDIVSQRYSFVDKSKLAVIPNGYDEQAFLEAEKLRSGTQSLTKHVLLHSGTIYLSADRDPTHLFRALRTLSDQGIINADTFELRLRDPSCEEELNRMTAETGVAHLVKILPSISYTQALAEMMGADGLLALQGYTSNPAVPAKLYEYLRARRPIIGLVDPDGETATTLRRAKIATVANIVDSTAIIEVIKHWISTARSQASGVADDATIAQYSRAKSTSELARLLDRVTARESL